MIPASFQAGVFLFLPLDKISEPGMLRRRTEWRVQWSRKKGRLEGGPEFWEETPIGAQALTRQGRDNALHNIEVSEQDLKPKFSFRLR